MISLLSKTFPVELKHELIDIMDENKCSIIEAESELIIRLLKKCKDKQTGKMIKGANMKRGPAGFKPKDAPFMIFDKDTKL